MMEKNNETWAITKGISDEGLPFVLRFREDLPEEREIEKMPMLVVVSWLYESPDGNGMPTEVEADRMETFENLIDETLVEKGTARLMMVFTGEGVREWQFYTDDEEFFMRKFNDALAGKEALPLDIEVFEDKNWDAFKDYTGIGIEE